MEKNIYENEKPEKVLCSTENSRGHKLVYTEEFKSFVAGHPGYIVEIGKTLEHMLWEKIENLSIDDLGIEIEQIDFGGSSPTYKLTLQDEQNEYFIKLNREPEDPHREILTMQYAKELLKEFPWAKVADYQCGYINNKKRGFYIAKWDESLTKSFSHVVWSLMKEDRQDLVYDANSKLKILLDKLTPLGFKDMKGQNMTYNTETGEITIYDFRLSDSISPGEKLRELKD